MKRFGPAFGQLIVGGSAGVVWLYVLGRLKSVYYYGTFGLDPQELGLDFQDYLFESWFPAQNVLFLILLWWIALKTRSRWVALVAVAHALIPIAAHYAFLDHDAAAAAFLIRYRHTLLKLVPFAVLVAVWTLMPYRRTALRSLAPPVPPAGLALFAIVALAWSISTAKHSGGFDGNLVLSEPEAHLPRARLGVSGPHGSTEFHVLRAGPDSVALWDPSGFVYGRTDEVRTLVVPRSTVEWIGRRRAAQVQPGNRFF